MNINRLCEAIEESLLGFFEKENFQAAAIYMTVCASRWKYKEQEQVINTMMRVSEKHAKKEEIRIVREKIKPTTT